MRPPNNPQSAPNNGEEDQEGRRITSEVDTNLNTAVRANIGTGMVSISDFVNDNLVAFRYGTLATVTLLTAYGLANTPLFFRYSSVADIPAKLFTGRKRLRARLIKTVENDQAGQPISCYVRHLSPAGSFLSRDLYELAAKIAPSAQAASGSGGANEASRDWMKIEIAGLSAPPYYTSNDYQRGEWLRQLADAKTVVNLQLLGRRVASSQVPAAAKKKSKREMSTVLPELQSSLDQESSNSHVEGKEQVAVCWVYYRPSIFQLFATDLADSLVRYGHACVESEVFMKNDFTSGTRVIDASTGLEDLRKDIKHLDRLEQSQLKGAEQSYGMWSDSSIREKRRDIMDEIEFQTNSNVFQRLWRWWRS